jgi:NADPH:quinone reductase-like Zn-dependent oxidoreductase
MFRHHPFRDHDDPVYMIWHHHERIHQHERHVFRYGIPTPLHDTTHGIGHHHPLCNFTESVRSTLGTDGDVVRTGPGIIVSLQPDGPAVMGIDHDPNIVIPSIGPRPSRPTTVQPFPLSPSPPPPFFRSMKAIVCARYGPPEQLQVCEVHVPVLKDRQVLVRVHATPVNDYDWSMVLGRPRIYRLFFGLFRPRRPIPGMELAGVVEALGPNATQWRVGDRVYGDTSNGGLGTFAEFVAVPETELRRIPAGLSFVEAAAIPHALELAYQAMVEIGKLKDGERVLLNGAGGGVGTFALQLAKQQGCTVWGVDTGEKLNAMMALGFDRVIDYKAQDFTKLGERFDLIVDMKTKRSPRELARALAPNGRYVTVGGDPGRLIAVLFARLFARRNMHIVSLKSNKNLDTLATLISNGTLKPVIDGPYALEDAPRLVRYFGEGRHTGKVVMEVGGTYGVEG